MKTLRRFLFAFIPVSILLLSSCGKYPDGPNFSILSRKSRLENVWVHKETAYANGTVEQNPNPGYTTEFTSDGDVIYTNDVLTLKGEWDLVNDKKDLMITYPDLGGSTFEIRRLKANELWLKNSLGDVLKYKPK